MRTAADSEANAPEMLPGALARARAEMVPAAVALVAVVFVLVVVRAELSAAADPRLFAPWLAATSIVVVLIVGGIGVFLWRQPGDAEVARFWLPFGRLQRTLLTLCIIAGIFVLMPHASDALRGVLMVAYVWYLATGTMANTDPKGMTWVALAGVPAALIFILLRENAPYAWPLSGFLALVGVEFFVLGKLIVRAEHRALAAGWRSDRDAAALRDALAVAAAERDAKTRFIAAASHDLQQPLQAAQLYMEAALAADARGRARAVDGARAAFAATGALLEDMLDHLRLEAGAMPVRPGRVALGDLLAAVAAEHAPAAAAAGLRIVALPSPLAATADAHLLRRALGNLVDNAVKHSGGHRVRLAARAAGGEVVLWVRDDGAGIVASDRQRLFDDYAQGATAGPGGFGLGLASVRRAAAAMGGSAGETPRRRGAAFWIRLPRAAAVAASVMVEPLCAAA